MRFLRRTAQAAALLAFFAAMASAQDAGLTARGAFAILPISLFENTPAGLDETARQVLLRAGRSQYWEIAGETADLIVFDELPFHKRAVAVRIFPYATHGGSLIAIGTLGDPVCTVELWNLDSAGRLTPVDTPVEPGIREFFTRKRRPPLEQQNSVLICLGLGGIWAKPVFWNEHGFSEPMIDNEISYQWNGEKLEKVARQVARPKKKKR